MRLFLLNWKYPIIPMVALFAFAVVYRTVGEAFGTCSIHFVNAAEVGNVVLKENIREVNCPIYVAALLFAISISLITFGVTLVHRRRAWGPLLLLISVIPFYAAWGLLLTKAGF